MAEATTDVMERIVALCKRRGFIFQSSEIYGGIGGFWDYGPLGTELKRNIKDAWWLDMVRNPPAGPGGREFQMVGLDCSIIMNPKVWEASGHVGGFSDPMVDCRQCKTRFRGDQLFVLRWFNVGEFINWLEAADPASALRELPELIERAPTWQAFDAAVREVLRLTDRDFTSGPKPYVKTVVASGAHEAVQLGQLTPREAKHLGYPSLDGPIPLTEYLKERDGPHWVPVRCPTCDTPGVLTEPRQFNLMFKTTVGAVEDASAQAYLRPETAQGIFANFQNVMDTSRVKIPFGIAQIGKAFRNEINPRNYTFRSREFEQMEIEFFCKPDELCRPGEVTAMQWYEFWRDVRIKWYTSLGIRSANLRPRQQGKEELAHYSQACTDIEYLFPFSDEPQELEGVAHRGCFDLSQHGKFAKGKEDAFAVLDDDTRDRYVPHVIEPSAGADRFTLAVICEAYSHDESRASPEFLKLHPRLAPIKAAVFPLVAKDGLPEIAEPIYREVRKHYPCQYDAKQSIGKRYARMDEAGTPFCFTIDGQTKEDGTLTVRDRDDASQIRIDKSRCLEYLREKLRL